MTLGFVTADEVSRNPGWDRLLDALALLVGRRVSHSVISAKAGIQLCVG